jgi:gamma-glutamyltranspeptidase
MPPVRLQLGGLRDPESVDHVLPPRPEMQIVTSDREAALAARDVLLAQGAAADAAVALGLTLAVTSPASAGLGAGGVCVARDAKGGLEAVDFRRARLARGLLALHARSGVRPWSSLVVSAETLARFGHRVSPALANEVATYGGALIQDPTALNAFMTQQRRLIAANDEWRQPRLSDTLAKMRTPRFLDGGGPDWSVPEAKSAAIALTPGTTGFAVADQAGVAVACSVTMGRPFGLGSMVRDAGYLFAAAAPEDVQLDQVALGFLACLKLTGEADKSLPGCPAPEATFSLLP